MNLLIEFVMISAPITAQLLGSLRETFYADDKNRLAQNACTRVDPLEVCTSRANMEEVNHVFNRRVSKIKAI